MEKTIYDSYLDILREELVPAMGCTEPIAVAYAAALARDTLGRMPEKTVLIVSGNIIKNVKSVIPAGARGSAPQLRQVSALENRRRSLKSFPRQQKPISKPLMRI